MKIYVSWRNEQEKIPKSFQFLIEMLTKLGSIINAYASTSVFLIYKSLALNTPMYSLQLFILDFEHWTWSLCLCGMHMHLFMLADVVVLPHPINGDSWHHYTILHSQLMVVPQWQRWSPSMMMILNLFGKFLRRSQWST